MKYSKALRDNHKYTSDVSMMNEFEILISKLRIKGYQNPRQTLVKHLILRLYDIPTLSTQIKEALLWKMVSLKEKNLK